MIDTSLNLPEGLATVIGLARKSESSEILKMLEIFESRFLNFWLKIKIENSELKKFRAILPG